MAPPPPDGPAFRHTLSVFVRACEGDIPPERRLWIAVVERALLDSFGNMSGHITANVRRRIIEDARQWLRDGGLDFETVTALAGLSDEGIRLRLDELLAVAERDIEARAQGQRRRWALVRAMASSVVDAAAGQ